MVSKSELWNMKDEELLHLYSNLMEELKDRDIIRSSNNPVADYAEKVAVEVLGLSRRGKEEKGYDAIDAHKNRYQIKGRRITKHNQSRQLGVIRNLDERLFDYLVAVIFNMDFSVKEIWEIPISFIVDNCKFSPHQNGHIFQAKPEILSNEKQVKRIR